MQYAIRAKEAAALVKMPPQYAKKIVNGVLRLKAKDNPILEPHELLTFVTAGWLGMTMPYSEADALALLTELQPFFREFAAEPHRIWCEDDQGCETPNAQLYIAESRWVTWPGRDDFFDPMEVTYVNPLPHNPVWFGALHLTAAYFAFLTTRDRQRGRDAKPPEDVARPAV